MIICHITSAHKRNDDRIIMKECYSLASAYEDVYCVVADGEGDDLENKIKIIDSGRKTKSRIKRITLVARKTIKIALDINSNIYHMHDPELLLYIGKLKRKGAKVIYDAHENLPLQIKSKPYLNPILAKNISHIVSFVEGYFAKKADLIVCATPSIAKRFKIINKSIVIRNYPLYKEMFKNNNLLEEKNRQICYTGGITKIRGIYEIVDAAFIARERIVICGEFESKELFRSIIKKDGWQYIDYRGFLPYEEMVKVIKKSISGLLILHDVPNYRESLPIKLFEYMAAGIPVIASNFPYFKNIIEKHKCGICVNPSSPQQIAEAIKFLIENPSEASEMGKRGEQAIREKYNWDSEAKILLRAYLELLDEGNV